MIKTVCVAGAGTMGSGIALTAAQNNFPVLLFDINPATLAIAELLIKENLDYLLKKGKIGLEQKQEIFGRIIFTSTPGDCKSDLIIEAIVEKIEAKAELFNQLSNINSPSCIFASNTSSLSITALQHNISHPGRVAGLHFFNPAHIMKLVEIVKGELTDDATISLLNEVCLAFQKVPVICNDAPGFIVNRVARHYYLEAMHLVEKGIASIPDVDKAMEAAGFKMGPFRLMDLIGMDINYAVSESIYAAFKNAERFKPSDLQRQKVENAELGRKSGKGFYDYPELHIP